MFQLNLLWWRQLAYAMPIVTMDATNPPSNAIKFIVSPVERLGSAMGAIFMPNNYCIFVVSWKCRVLGRVNWRFFAEGREGGGNR
jgi:hypothetical protein